jgi:hypothetical protein
LISWSSVDYDVSDASDDEQHRVSVQVEHVEEKENEIAKSDDVVHET